MTSHHSASRPSGERDKKPLSLETIDDIPTFWCWDEMVRFDITGMEAHRGHDTTLRTVFDKNRSATIR